MAKFRPAWIIAILLSTLAPLPAAAQSPDTTSVTTTATAFDLRAAQLVDLLAGKIAFADYFDPSFQTAVPEAQFQAINASLIAQYGAPVAVDSATSPNGRAGTVMLRFEKGVGTIALEVDPGSDARVTGLRQAQLLFDQEVTP